MKTQARRCTCWGIPYYSTEDESFFQGCGTVTELDCMIFRENGKFTGIAIVSFKMEAATKRALALGCSDSGLPVHFPTEEIKVRHEVHVMRFLLELSAVAGIEKLCIFMEGMNLKVLLLAKMEQRAFDYRVL
ncbi:uncharacterized protein LOC144700791 isoform X5 [Wolffia australiana]